MRVGRSHTRRVLIARYKDTLRRNEMATLEDAFGHPEPGKYCASMVRRVLDLAFDEGHSDPRHSEHWWEWVNWPIDGRQWEYNGQINRYEVNNKAVADHEKRVHLGGIRGSDLKIERISMNTQAEYHPFRNNIIQI